MNKQKAKLSAQRDRLLKEANEAGTWNQNRYNEIIRLEKSIGALIPKREPDPYPDKRKLDIEN